MKNIETIHERVTDLVERFGDGKNTVFSSIIGCSEANLRGYRTTVMPKFDFFEKVARTFDINLRWLLTGEGNMMDGITDKKITIDNTRSIPIVDISVAAGCGGYINRDNLDVIDNINLPSNMLSSTGKYYCVRVKGESMVPTLLDSSYVILRLLEPQEWGDIHEQHIYVISDKEGKSYIKRVKNRLNRGFITCMSDNLDKANYPNFNLQYEEINTILHAEWYISAKMPNINETYYKRMSELEDRVDDIETKLLKKIQ